MDDIYAEALRVMNIETRWIEEAARLAKESLPRAVSLLAEARGKVVVCGIGKSGHVGRKIAATMTSTGTPAYFLHPSEGIHGDIGILQKGDVALVLSKSGETDEIAMLLTCFRRLDTPVVAITGTGDSLLARSADVVICLPEMKEACPHDLAPTASTTAMMALGDSLAMALLRIRGFSPEDFAMVHPGGTIGRKLLTRVGDLMFSDNLPELDESVPLADAIAVMTSHRGVCFSTDGDNRLSGIFVYGDLGRLMKNRENVLDLKLRDVLIRDPLTCRPDELATAAVSRMEEKGVTCLVAVDSERVPRGVLYLHDCLQSGVK
ncbi:MAG: KpsF/GutQ family sugar-phosphate isomerase [Candidatus Aegiribacteria sp.]|nr:KpsF/GutQ family sugar-phosphate isomerase [Candidatus Aegiribacteria sp.]MBD3293968.1 KpsF/GutQ family sugar-phosphate isomerase [Candidatus Fermentibacteria bacterium]